MTPLRRFRRDYSACGFSPVHGDKIAVLEVYLDESGVHSDSVLIVGGFVADINKWADFSAYWKDVLTKYGLKYFHATAFMNGKDRAFRHLSMIQKRDLLGLLIAGIRETALFSMSVLAKPYEYDQFATAEYKQAFGSCYSHSVRAALIGITRLLKDPNNATETLGVFIERSPRSDAALHHVRDHRAETEPFPRSFETEFDILPRRYDWNPDDPCNERGIKIGAVGSGSKEDMPPLQAADLLVFMEHSFIVGSKSKAKWKNSWDNIAEHVPPYIFPFTPKLLKLFVDGYMERLEEGRDNKHATAQFIREANSFGLHGKVVPYKGVTLSGNAHDVQTFREWMELNPGRFRRPIRSDRGK
jgi:hypothetical protein